MAGQYPRSSVEREAAWQFARLARELARIVADQQVPAWWVLNAAPSLVELVAQARVFRNRCLNGTTKEESDGNETNK